MGSGHMRIPLWTEWQKDTTENITFWQLRWRATKILNTAKWYNSRETEKSVRPWMDGETSSKAQAHSFWCVSTGRLLRPRSRLIPIPMVLGFMIILGSGYTKPMQIFIGSVHILSVSVSVSGSVNEPFRRNNLKGLTLQLVRFLVVPSRGNRTLSKRSYCGCLCRWCPSLAVEKNSAILRLVDQWELVVSNLKTNFYRPQRSCGQGYVFTRVCDSVHRGGGCLSACWDTTPPEGDPPGRRHPPPEGDPLVSPPGRSPPGIWSMSGRCASYWNAFLYWMKWQHTEPVNLFQTSSRHLDDLCQQFVLIWQFIQVFNLVIWIQQTWSQCENVAKNLSTRKHSSRMQTARMPTVRAS